MSDKPTVSPILDEARRRSSRLSAPELRAASPRRRITGGYRSGGVDELLERAARTIDELAATVERWERKAAEMQGTIDGLHAAQSALEVRLQEPRPRPVEEVASEMIVTAHRAIDQAKEEARQEAAQVVAGGRGQAEAIVTDAQTEANAILADAAQRREDAEQLRREAESTLAEARQEASALREQGRLEGEEFVDDAIVTAEKVRTALEAEKERLQLEIDNLRSEWVGFVSDALARLDEIEPPQASSSSRGDELAGGIGAEPGGTEADSLVGGDVASELHGRLPNSTALDTNQT